jgi:hypothetical protein
MIILKIAIFWDVELCSLVVTADVSEDLTAYIIIIIYQTAWCTIPEGGHLHTDYCENHRSH